MEKDLRVLYGVWPAAGAFATFALSNGVIQLYWLQDGGTRPTWLLGCWFALYNVVKLVFVGLAPRYGWHQQDCKVREVARARGALPADGCDCTHYCWSPHFWRHYFAALRDAVRS